MKRLNFIKNGFFVQSVFFLLVISFSNCWSLQHDHSDFTLDFKYTSSWHNGFVGVITVTNYGDVPIEGWEISFKGNFGISEEWNACKINRESLNGGFRYYYKCKEWNRIIKAGESRSFGFTAFFDGELPQPLNMKLNGTEPEKGLVQSFYANWAVYGGKYPQNLPLEHLDRIIHAFALVTEDGIVTHEDKYSDIEMLLPGDTPDQAIKGTFNQYNLIKNSHPNIKICYSIIAKNHNRIDFKNAAATEESRTKFVLSAIEFMKTYNFDGINIDWEFPDSSDTDNLTELVKLMREELDRVGFEDNKHYELSFSSPAGYHFLKDINLTAISEYLDQVSIMGFNYFGPWEQTTGHNSPLYHNVTPEMGLPLEIEEYLKTCNVDWTINYHLQNGVSSDKIILGMPIYSHSWINVFDAYENGGLFSIGQGIEPIFYTEVLSLYHDSGYTRYWDDLSKTAYLYHPEKRGGHFVTFEDTTAIRFKSEYINEKSLKGAAFWMGALDATGEESLIKKASETLIKLPENSIDISEKVKGISK